MASKRSAMLCYLIHGSQSLQRRTALAGMLCMQLQRPVTAMFASCLWGTRASGFWQVRRITSAI
ncbi:unnamed protein product [Symbiodinium sp. CCMP2592]|nr:unnamed protein product [Symbiodinium sp. CCMP2592]